MRRMRGRYKGFRCARMVGASSVGEEWKKAARKESTGPQEMEEPPWGREAVRAYQVYLATPGLGGEL